MQPFSLEKPVAHSTASKFSAVLIGRIVSRYIYNSVVGNPVVPKDHRDFRIVVPCIIVMSLVVTSFCYICGGSIKTDYS